MNHDPILTLGRLRIFASRDDDRAWRVSTWTDSVIRSLKFAAGRYRLAFTLTRPGVRTLYSGKRR